MGRLASLLPFVLPFIVVIGPEVYFRFVRPAADWGAYRGDWALVTGSSYGIGRAFALELARRYAGDTDHPTLHMLGFRFTR